jgi:hypothetical protein
MTVIAARNLFQWVNLPVKIAMLGFRPMQGRSNAIRVLLEPFLPLEVNANIVPRTHLVRRNQLIAPVVLLEQLRFQEHINAPIVRMVWFLRAMVNVAPIVMLEKNSGLALVIRVLLEPIRLS